MSASLLAHIVRMPLTFLPLLSPGEPGGGGVGGGGVGGAGVGGAGVGEGVGAGVGCGERLLRSSGGNVGGAVVGGLVEPDLLLLLLRLRRRRVLRLRRRRELRRRRRRELVPWPGCLPAPSERSRQLQISVCSWLPGVPAVGRAADPAVQVARQEAHRLSRS